MGAVDGMHESRFSQENTRPECLRMHGFHRSNGSARVYANPMMEDASAARRIGRNVVYLEQLSRESVPNFGEQSNGCDDFFKKGVA